MTEATPPTVPGLLVGRALGAHAWLGRDLGSGGLVVVRSLPAGADPERLAGAVAHPRLLLPRAVAAPDGGRLLVAPWLPGGGLDTVLSGGALTPGQVATVVCDLAEVLALLHGSGRVHGGVRAEAVLLDSAGRAVLDGTALALSDGAERADDVRALATLALGCLGEAPDRPAPALRQRLEVARSGETPGARELGRAVAGVAAPQPVRRGPSRGAAPTGNGRQRHARLRRPGLRRSAAVLAATAALGLAVAAGTWWAGHAGGPAPQELAAAVSPPAAPTVDWVDVVTALDARRAAAFTAGDPTLLAAVVAPGSPAAQSDEAALAALAARGLSVVGLATDVVSVLPVQQAADQVTLRVADVRRAYRLTRADGSQEGGAPERAGTWQVELRSGPDGDWRVYRAVPTSAE